MSRQFNNNKINNSAVNSRKPFCKVCADAGKSDTAHFPRKTPDPNSEVTCPTLKALECRYCFKNGHTVKYCPVLKERNARDDDARREHERHQRHLERQMEQERQSRLPPIVEKKATGKFAAFIDEDEEEERNERQEQDMRLKIEEAAAALIAKRDAEFPTFGLKKAAPTTDPTATNWAAMAQNAAALPLPKLKAKAVVEEKPKLNYVGWAEDSDDECEEEMYESVIPSDDDEPTTSRPLVFPSTTTSLAPSYVRATSDDCDW